MTTYGKEEAAISLTMREQESLRTEMTAEATSRQNTELAGEIEEVVVKYYGFLIAMSAYQPCLRSWV